MASWQPLLEQLMAERYPRLVARAMLLTPTRADAEDLVQEVLLATFTGRARFASIAEAEAYVRRALVTRSIDGGRRRQAERRALRRLQLERSPGAPSPTADLVVDVERSLAGLPPRERACVVLRHLEDLPIRDVANLLNLSEGAVKRYTSDGVSTLNAALGTTEPRETAQVTLSKEGSTHA